MNEVRSARNGVRMLAAFAVGALLLLPVVGCAAKGVEASSAPSTGFPVTITDDASRTVTIEAPAKRIVSLAPANTEIVYSLGILDRLVGVTTWDDYPAQVSAITKVGDFTTPNIEAIAGARPDLILVTGGVQADVVGRLEAIGAAVVVIDPQTLQDVHAAIRTVAQITGTSAQGETVVKGMERDIAAIASRVGGSARVATFVEIGWNPLYTAGPGTLLDDLVTAAGGKNVVKEPGYVGYSVEQLVVDQPVVYLGTLSSLGDAAALGERPGYASIAAIRTGRVVSLDDNLVSRPGPRLAEGVRQIAVALHPESFVGATP